MVDALVSGSSAERHAGSIPVPGTKIYEGICRLWQIPFFVIEVSEVIEITEVIELIEL